MLRCVGTIKEVVLWLCLRSLYWAAVVVEGGGPRGLLGTAVRKAILSTCSLYVVFLSLLGYV